MVADLFGGAGLERLRVLRCCTAVGHGWKAEELTVAKAAGLRGSAVLQWPQGSQP